MVTTPSETPETRKPDARPSLLPFDPAQLTAVRVTPAEFARLCGVSRQAVSKWIAKGYFSTGVDGRFDPAWAFRRVLERADPARLRARLFRDAVAPVSALRARIRELEAQVDAIAQATRYQCDDETAGALWRLTQRLEANWPALLRAQKAGRLADEIDGHVGAVFYAEHEESCTPEAAPDANTHDATAEAGRMTDADHDA